MDIKTRVPGKVIKFEKNVSDVVKKGDIVAVMEAMKMQNPIPSPCDGTVVTIHQEANVRLNPGTVIMTIE
ncbi:MAG: acetyl-CoA carboxylase biotin carboxyl carrier protein subunit [Clostridiales bacterium]|nr:MAG: acetyl-CoA carboxylase biotin carboxyl carrier protein subunit [Clostridiales bacterium]